MSNTMAGGAPVNLRRCPCGKVPTGFDLDRLPYSNDYYLQPNCCGKWTMILRFVDSLDDEIDTNTVDVEKTHQAAAQAWNDMPREGE